MQQDIERQQSDEIEVDIVRILRNALRIVKKLWLLILLVIAFFAATVVFVQQSSYTPSYKAYCTFSVHVINKATLSDTNSIYAVYYDQDLAEQLDATFSYLINSDFLADDIKEYLGETTIDGHVEANSIEGSNIFVISAFSSTPENAGALLEALMAVYYDVARYVVGDMTTEVIEGPMISRTPYNTPSRTKGIAIGAAIGLVLSLGVIALFALLKRTVFEPADLEKQLNMQCFGVVPLLQAKRNLSDSPATVSVTQEQGFFRESVRGVARKLESAIKRRNIKVMLVTSTAAGEGKSVLSRHLAESFAYWGKKVVLLDGDLRRPTLYQRFGLKREHFPLGAVLSGNTSLDTAFFQKQEGNLTLVLNSIPVKNPTLLIDSSAMKDLIASLSAQADLVIIDTPPCGQLSDVALFQQYADGVLYVVQQDRIPIRQIVEAAERLCDSENKLLGCVINGAEQLPQGYGKYGYGKYGYGKYGYGKYNHSKYGHYGVYGEASQQAKTSER